MIAGARTAVHVLSMARDPLRQWVVVNWRAAGVYDAGGILTEADIDALLHDMETQVMEEIQAELAELERQEQEQLQHAADMVEQHMQYLQQQQQHTGQGEHADGTSSSCCRRRGHACFDTKHPGC